MTIEEFKRRVYRNRESLTIIDNAVLKVGDYDHFHPGGRFTMKKNYGRDISKYFYGAYKLVNESNEKNYNHSAGAVLMASSMIIAYLVGQARVKPIKVFVENC